MLLIAGIIPIADLPLIKGTAQRIDDFLLVDGHKIPCGQGTAAMVSSALAATSYLGIDPPEALLVGDIGPGEGSRLLYDYLINNIKDLQPEVLALHYWKPDLKQMRDLISEINKMEKKPILIADAASMYTAKAVGLANEFDIFTPDASEMAFLADPDAIHPAYIDLHLFRADINKTPELVEKAYLQKGAAKNLLVKGSTDFIVIDGKIIEKISEPNIPELECIGGTGDTIAGMVSAFVYAELEPYQAAVISAKANRVAGEKIQANPATKVIDIINALPAVFKENLCTWSGICCVSPQSDN